MAEVVIKSANAMPLLLSAMVGYLLGLVTWGVVQRWQHSDRVSHGRSYDEILLILLALATFALGAFVTYIVLGMKW
jgi:hypothetical protein